MQSCTTGPEDWGQDMVVFDEARQHGLDVCTAVYDKQNYDHVFLVTYSCASS